MKKRVKSKTSKKDSFNLKSAFIVFIILALSLFLAFNNFNPSPSLSAIDAYSGLPNGFEPEVAYYSPFAGGLIGLWSGQDYYISTDGTNFNEISTAIYTNLGLPSDFTPDTGYAHDIQGGLAGLWDNSRVAGERYYGWNGAGNFFNIDLATVPANEIIILGYWHKFGGVGRVTLFNDKGEAYLWDSSKGTISKLTQATLVGFGLPSTGNPRVGYYYNFNGMERVDLWYGNVLYRSTGGNFVRIDTITGISGVPSAGYWDKKRNKIVVWVGPIAYESSNGNTFELIYDGTIQDLTPQLIASYSLNGNAQDSSANNRHGTVNGATPTPDKNGISNFAYSFDGTNDYINFGDINEMELANDLTFSAWINPSAMKNNNMIASKGCGGGSGWTIGLDPNNYLYLDIESTTGELLGQRLTLNQWKHVSFTFSKTTGETKLYLDGVLQGTATISSYYVPPSSQSFNLGACNSGGNDGFFNGKIDEVKAYNKVLSASEILALYSMGVSEPKCTTANANTNCDDGNPETLNLCTNNVCENPPAPDCTTNSQCATNQVCSNNICVSGSTCVDRDGSLGLGIASTVSSLDGTLIGRDSCDTSGFILTEWYCNENGEGDSFEYECMDSCSNGKCVGALPDLVCRDSDDGDDENEFGIIELIDDETEEVLASFRDSCISDKRVNEFSCNGDEEQSEAIRCNSDKICRNGECVSQGLPNPNPNPNPNPPPTSCIANTERCSGTNTEVCLNSAWVNIGNQEGKCGYSTTILRPNTISCNSNADCDSDEFCNDSGKCQFEQAPDDLTNLYIAIGVIIFVILIVLGVIIFITIKNKNKRENHPPKSLPANNSSINFNQPGNRRI